MHIVGGSVECFVCSGECVCMCRERECVCVCVCVFVQCGCGCVGVGVCQGVRVCVYV